MKSRNATGLSLWALVESLQNRFEGKGFDAAEVDAAVIGRVGSLLARRGKNDQKLARPVDLRSLLVGPTVVDA